MRITSLNSRHLAWPLLLACCFPIPAQAIRCSGELSATEKLICSSPDLKQLDAQLNASYNAAINIPSHDKKVLETEQRKWLKTSRDACSTKECLAQTYIVRINQLQYLQVKSFGLLEKPLSEQEAKDACNSLKELGENDRLSDLAVPGQNQGQKNTFDSKTAWMWGLSKEEKAGLVRSQPELSNAETVYNLQLTNEGKPQRYVRFSTGGSCPSYDTYSLPYLMTAKGGDYGVESVADAEEEMRWVHFGSDHYPIVHKGRYYGITTDVGNKNTLRMVSWLKPDGKIRPLCLFKPSEQRIVKSAQDKDKPLCAKIAGGGIKPLSWKPLPFKFQFERYSDERADDLNYLDIDLDNDGTVESIGRFEFSSSGGCGGTRAWLAVLSKKRDAIDKTPLNETLKRLAGNSTEIYKYENQYYIDTSGGEDVEGLVQVHHGRIEPACTFTTKTEMTHFFKP